MSAKDSVSPSQFGTGQLAMFVEAGSLKNDISHGDQVDYSSSGKMWHEKEKESAAKGSSVSAHRPSNYDSEPSLKDSVKSSGVREPVVVDVRTSPLIKGPYLYDGHHRVATAASHSPDTLVPVSYIDTTPKNPSWVIME